MPVQEMYYRETYPRLALETAKNTVILPDFLVWKFCGKAQLPHQEIRWNYGIFRSGTEELEVSLKFLSHEQSTFHSIILNGLGITFFHYCQSMVKGDPVMNVWKIWKYLSIPLSLYLSIYLSICLSVCLSIYLPTYLPTYLSICIYRTKLRKTNHPFLAFGQKIFLCSFYQAHCWILINSNNSNVISYNNEQ